MTKCGNGFITVKGCLASGADITCLVTVGGAGRLKLFCSNGLVSERLKSSKTLVVGASLSGALLTCGRTCSYASRSDLVDIIKGVGDHRKLLEALYVLKTYGATLAGSGTGSIALCRLFRDINGLVTCGNNLASGLYVAAYGALFTCFASVHFTGSVLLFNGCISVRLLCNGLLLYENLAAELTFLSLGKTLCSAGSLLCGNYFFFMGAAAGCECEEHAHHGYHKNKKLNNVLFHFG